MALPIYIYIFHRLTLLLYREQKIFLFFIYILDLYRHDGFRLPFVKKSLFFLEKNDFTIGKQYILLHYRGKKESLRKISVTTSKNQSLFPGFSPDNGIYFYFIYFHTFHFCRSKRIIPRIFWNVKNVKIRYASNSKLLEKRSARNRSSFKIRGIVIYHFLGCY